VSELAEYYRERAAEYDAVYAKPERQQDLARLHGLLSPLVAGQRVLEVAAGTGYWTRVLSGSAAAITATAAPDVRDAADTELAAFWVAVYQEARALAGGEESGLVVAAGLAAVPYLLRRADWDAATGLLRDTSLPVTLVAEKVGYTSEAAFSRAYKHRYGTPPARWRREIRQKRS